MMNLMKEHHTPPTARNLPRWLILSFFIGVPTIVTIVGLMIGAHVVEIVIFSMLCLFSLALVFFYALG
jgi:hypothetical protein